MADAYFEAHPTDPNKVILRKPTMMWEGSLHVVCQCDKCKTQPQREWVGLTDDELTAIADSMRAWNSFSIQHIYTAIEAKLKEKNNAN
jgi:hypothetical protein